MTYLERKQKRDRDEEDEDDNIDQHGRGLSTYLIFDDGRRRWREGRLRMVCVFALGRWKCEGGPVEGDRSGFCKEKGGNGIRNIRGKLWVR